MKKLLFASLLTISTLSFALVQSDTEARQFLKSYGAGHGDFIESADSLIIDSCMVIPKGSHCISLPIKAVIKKHHLCCTKDAGSDSLSVPGKITVYAKKLPLFAVIVRQNLYVGRSFKEIANTILSKNLH